MDYLNAPTDNLYKFAALAGIAIAITSIVFPVRYALDLNQKVIDLKRQNVSLNMSKAIVVPHVIAHQKRADLLQKDFQKVTDLIKELEKSPTPERRDEIVEAVKQNQKFMAEMGEESLDIEKRSREFMDQFAATQATEQEVEFLMLTLHVTGYVAGASALFGIILALWGFWRWYFRLQIYQDQIVANEAAIEKKEQEKRLILLTSQSD